MCTVVRDCHRWVSWACSCIVYLTLSVYTTRHSSFPLKRSYTYIRTERERSKEPVPLQGKDSSFPTIFFSVVVLSTEDTRSGRQSRDPSVVSHPSNHVTPIIRLCMVSDQYAKWPSQWTLGPEFCKVWKQKIRYFTLIIVAVYYHRPCIFRDSIIIE